MVILWSDYDKFIPNGEQNTTLRKVCQCGYIFYKNKKGAVLPRLFNGGGTRIRTLEGYANRFTVCPV